MQEHTEGDDLPVLVMLHGFLGTGEQFSSLFPLLRSFCKVVTIDLLGHGKTEGAELPYRFAAKEQIADITKLLREQFVDPVFLYGYSMGARLALQVALAHPELLQGLILESGTFGIESESERQMRQSLDASRADDIMGDYHRFLDQWDELPIFNTTGAQPLHEYQYARRDAQEPLWMANSLLGFGTGSMPCVRDRLPELQLPVLLITGDKDPKFQRINHTMFREIPDATLNIIHGAGHRPHLDQPLEVANKTGDFISRNAIPDTD